MKGIAQITDAANAASVSLIVVGYAADVAEMNVRRFAMAYADYRRKHLSWWLWWRRRTSQGD